MAIVMSLLARGMTIDDYDTAARVVNTEVPDGLLLHTAGATDEGVRVVDFWESPEQFQRFADGTLGPQLAAQGFTDPPEITIYELHNVWAPRLPELEAMSGSGSQADR
jgi:hypothetical protein